MLAKITTENWIAIWAIVVPASLAIIGGLWRYFASRSAKTKKKNESNIQSDSKPDNEKLGQKELDQSRKEALTYSLNILVWGPTKDGSMEYKARCEIRDKLNELGHDARFSEEYCNQTNALDDPVNDERLQAEYVDAIVMVYGSRGTQTELDRIIIPNKEIAVKTTILIKNSMLNSIKSSLSNESWRELSRNAEIINYSELPSDEDFIEKICERMHKLRQIMFINSLDSNKKQLPEIKNEIHRIRDKTRIGQPIPEIEPTVLETADPTSKIKYRIIEVYK